MDVRAVPLRIERGRRPADQQQMWLNNAHVHKLLLLLLQLVAVLAALDLCPTHPPVSSVSLMLLLLVIMRVLLLRMMMMMMAAVVGLWLLKLGLVMLITMVVMQVGRRSRQ